MTERGRGREHDPERRLDDADFEGSPYYGIPRRTRARPHIDTAVPGPLPELPAAGRRLSRAERRALRDRRAPAPVPPSVRGSGQGRSRSLLKLGGILAASIALVALGTDRFLGVGGSPTPAPAPTVQVIADVPTHAPLRPTPPPTEPPEPTPRPTETPEPTPAVTPTPDPRYVGKVVCLDPGHGGWDPGYTRDANDAAPAMDEAFYNLAFARALRVRLEHRGFTVVLTRDRSDAVNHGGADVNGDGETGRDSERARQLDELQARINVCNAAGADLLVSMHINGFDDPSADGYETWYSSARGFTERNKLFAELAYEELGRQMRAAGYNATARGVNDDATADVDIGRDAFDRYVITGPAVRGKITPSTMPGAIVEVLFISNDADAAFLASNEGRRAIVTAYERAITRYFDAIDE